MKSIVITTINGLTAPIQRYQDNPTFKDYQIIVVGDNKTPHIKSSGNLTYLSIQDQEKLGYKIIKKIPYNQYCRKNIGYLFAMKSGSDMVYETDDDNYPYSDWEIPTNFTDSVSSSSSFLNVCSLFTREHIWPRGFPLELINDSPTISIAENTKEPDVIQTLADNDPDVDAIYRLTSNKPVIFDKNKSIVLAPGTFTPFNSQCTFWMPKAFNLMYFPMFVSWRFADILRSYVTQKLLWDSGSVLGYTSPVVYQERTRHDYMNDFRQEVVMYTSVMKTVNVLRTFNSKPSIIDVYIELYKHGIVPIEEVDGVSDWMESIA